MKLARKVGATSQIFQLFIQNSSSTVGAGLTGLAFNTASLTAYYNRDTDTTATAISLVTMTAGTFTSSGFVEIDATNMPGWYQFCPPNAALASGASSVGFHLKGATNMAPVPIEIDLDAQVDVTFWNGTAVASPATAGIPDVNAKNLGNTAQTGRDLGTSVLLSSGTGTGQISLSSGLVSLSGTQTFNVTGNITGNLTGSVGSVTGAVGSVTGNVDGDVVGSVGSVSGLTASNLDTTISSRMATYSQPTGFLAATFPSGTIANTTNITAGTMTTTTDLTNAPTAGDFTAAMKSSLDAATPASVVGAVGSVTAAVTVGTINASASNVKKNTSFDLSFPMTDETTHAPTAGYTVAATRSIDGGAFGACANSVTEVSSGVYNIILAAADTNGNSIIYRFTATGADDRLMSVITQP